MTPLNLPPPYPCPQPSSSNVENFNPQIVRQVTREVVELSQNSPEGIKVFLNEEDVTDIQATIDGPGLFGAGETGSGVGERSWRGWGVRVAGRAGRR